MSDWSSDVCSSDLVEAFTGKTYDDRDVEAFLTMPIGYDPAARRKYPLIAVIHGGPHGQQGPAFSAKNQALAAKGYASLMVTYRSDELSVGKELVSTCRSRWSPGIYTKKQITQRVL